jgi:CRP-like cAMP-binding protein
VVSAMVGVSYNALAAGGPNWIPILWLSVFASINGIRIIGILREKLSINFSEEEKELYETIFRNFNPVEYMKLLRAAEWRDMNAGIPIAKEGEPIDGVFLLYHGEVSVEKAGKEIGRPRDGAMIGEMSFIQGENVTASASVTTTQKCRCVFWPKGELRALIRRNPTIDVALNQVFSIDLAKKLKSS